MQLELHTPPPEPEELEEPEEAPVTHLGVPEYEKRENYLTEKHITTSMFKLINKLDKNDKNIEKTKETIVLSIYFML